MAATARMGVGGGRTSRRPNQKKAHAIQCIAQPVSTVILSTRAFVYEIHSERSLAESTAKARCDAGRHVRTKRMYGIKCCFEVPHSAAS